jgi:SAM-dependent methyltransferase
MAADGPRLKCPACAASNPIDAAGAATLRKCPSCGAPISNVNGILQLGDAAGAEDDYPAALYDIVAQAETGHFWFAARNDIILNAARRSIGSLDGRRLLDVGCGTGYVMAALERAGAEAWGIDMHLAALERARARVAGPLLWSQAERLPFEEDFEVVSLFDVIEHVTDDVSVLREAHRVLRPGGFVMVSVPAGPHLWTDYDTVIGHKRRYTRQSLRAAFARSGLQPLDVRYFNCLPALAQRLQRRIPVGDGAALDMVAIVRRALRMPPAAVNAALRRFLPFEAPLGRLPFMTGASLVAVGRRGN